MLQLSKESTTAGQGLFGECYGGEVAGDTINGYNSGSAEINGLANGSTDAGNGYIHGSAEINGLANGSTDGGGKRHE